MLIVSPLDGWASALDEVPDAVFAGRMLGDGLAVDPTSCVVRAPCDGEITTLLPSNHAVSIRSPQGIEVLVHVGIDTVKLGGKGFSACVASGAKVKVGDELIRFDLDLVARGAKSLMTPIVVTSDGVSLRQRHGSGLVKAGDPLFEIVGSGTLWSASVQAAAPATLTAAQDAQQEIVIKLRQGLHARPAALLAQRAKRFDARISLAAHGRSADARSVVSIMALGVRHGDPLIVSAHGQAASEAVASMAAGIDEAVRMEANHASQEPPPSGAAAQAQTSSTRQAGELAGLRAVPGFAVGRATRIERREINVVELGSGASFEQAELTRAQANVRARLERVRNTGDRARKAIIAAHLEFLDDPTLNESAQQLIAAGKSAGFAWRDATRRSIAALQSLDDARLSERADDLLDVEAHLLLALAGEARPMHQPLPDHAVLLADDLLPSELTSLDRKRLVAIALSGGGATSHVAILAAAMEIPMLIGLGAALRDVGDGQSLIVDADQGILHTAPSSDALAKARAAVAERSTRSAALRRAAASDCYSRDGTRIEVFANLGNIGDAVAAVANGAEGCGLLRTEFLFLDRETPPTEDEQLQAYQGIADTLAGRPMILRMMDVGGDKPLKYLPLPAEENPALGLRGVRTALLHPELMRTQLRAALRVAPSGAVRVLIPMITDAAEIRAVRAELDQIAGELNLSGRVLLGAMIETPAAALTAAALIREVDFLSIGSNDLTQYSLAMDRGHPALAGRTDALHPAVLQLIAAAARDAVAAGKLVAVCGGVAADSTAVPILLGLGIGELSVVPAMIPALKRQIGGLRIEACRELARQCLLLSSAAEVRDRVERTLVKWGDAS